MKKYRLRDGVNFLIFNIIVFVRNGGKDDSVRLLISELYKVKNHNIQFCEAILGKAIQGNFKRDNDEIDDIAHSNTIFIKTKIVNCFNGYSVTYSPNWSCT